jgi:hypothetical protein
MGAVNEPSYSVPPYRILFPKQHVWITLVLSEADKRTKLLVMIVILLTAILAGGYIGKMMRSPSEQPGIVPAAVPVEAPRSQ